MKRLIAISQRVVIHSETKERRDALDQNWIQLLDDCNLLPILISNREKTAMDLLAAVPISGILLTGGNDLIRYGGDASERDHTERRLLSYACKKNIPLLGVCRGMQVIQNYFGVELEKVRGHIQKKQTIFIKDQQREVNSYHNWGTSSNRSPLKIWARAEDGIVKAIRHEEKSIMGIMWHPERMIPFHSEDINMINNFFHQ